VKANSLIDFVNRFAKMSTSPAVMQI